MLQLSICLPYNKFIHGYRNNEFNPDGHYLNEMTMNLEEFYSEGVDIIDRIKSFYKNVSVYDGYPIYIEPNIQIVSIYNIENYSPCIPKTYGLKIFQRKWKKYYSQKIKFYKNIKHIRMRELTGKFPHFKLE